jgi:arginyl-tRNA--protein-N-Asp/Glu arginylyltransferase
MVTYTMNTINVKRTVYTKEDKQLLDSSIYRKVIGEVFPDKNKVIVRVGIRTVGAFIYEISNRKTCKIISGRVIESEWNPTIIAVDTLSKYFKKTKEAERIQWAIQ